MKPDSPDDRRHPPDDGADETAWLAEQLESLPPVEPRPDWLAESKQRLLDRFDEQQSRQTDQAEPAD